ncbi:RidA family protein [Desulfitobacterium sp.]|uniref:RidA family protein n=1 Tax=Desulfitobacterium sp. TaxID=49981 RepID=UPI002B555E69|nr:RidA family protein [Desulfitobacterium sp.]HVJ50241.1 RidA family protein [Desulfitobacterium sp.]
MSKECISTERAPKAIGPYSQAIKANGFIFVSGQLPMDPALGKMPEKIEDQAKQSMENLAAIIREAGSDLNRVVKTTIFLTNLDDFQTVNEVYGQYFSGNFPARSTVQVAKLPLGAHVEIEAIVIV